MTRNEKWMTVGAILATVALMIIAISVQGCVTVGTSVDIPTPPSVCDNMPVGDSLLCDLSAKYQMRLESVGDIFMTANVIAIEGNAYAASDALQFFRTAKAVVDKATTGQQLFIYANSIITQSRLVAVGLVLVGPYIQYLNTTDPLTAKDKEMLNAWLDQQISLLQ